MKYNDSPPSAGFTVLELVIALSISTVVILFTTLIFVEGVRSIQLTVNESRLVTAAAHMTSTLTYEIRGARSVHVAGGGGELHIIDRDGSSRVITGSSLLPNAVEPSVLTFAQVGRTIIVEYELNYLTSSTQSPAITPRPLLGGVAITMRN